MGRWCNTAYQRVQFPDSPTLLYESYLSHSDKELKHAATYVEEHFFHPDHAFTNKDHLRYSHGLYSHAAPHHRGSKSEFYSNSEGNSDKETSTGKGGALKRVCTPDSDPTKKTETYQNSTKDGNINRRHQSTSKTQEERRDRRILGSSSFQDDELPFQEGAPL